jgi:hypothetical protein
MGAYPVNVIILKEIVNRLQLHSISIKFGIYTELVRLIKMCVLTKGTVALIGEHLHSAFPI